MTPNKQALRVPERKRHSWSQAVMRDCDFCSQWSLTVEHENGGHICASCCDAEYTSELKCALEVAIERADAAEKRNAELEAREVKVKQFSEFQICHYGASEDYAKGYIDCQKNYNKALGAANILVSMEG